VGQKSIKILKWIVPLALGAYLIYLPYSSFSESERASVYSSIKEANYFYVILSLVLALASHLSRAWRWNYMLQELGPPPKFLTNVMAIGAGYVINLFIPRGGEIARAGVIKKSDGIPMDRALGTIIAERVLDLIVLLSITLVAFLQAADELIPFFKSSYDALIHRLEWQQLLVIGVIAFILIIVIYILARKLNFVQKLIGFLAGLKDGFMTIWTMEKKGLYLLHTLFIWAMYLLMFYVCFHAVSDFQNIEMPAVLSAFVAGSFSVAFVNGGFGAYPYLIAQVLMLFGYSQTLGTSIGWLLWLSQTLLVITYGSISLVLISLNEKLFTK